jgi:hypothetical protein
MLHGLVSCFMVKGFWLVSVEQAAQPLGIAAVIAWGV